ncbi:c-type cytochrome [Hyphomicrobium sp.]|uniref:c-type cytochrome n=1 Tax=Hyphomicrobium sp. TaxID=82 RepID=UPI000FBC84DC|nr:c-type cytochrome [Hyphomicrobium sp.]RUP08300.1 MAG: c-type cytochrome [Hyphomicrobium sp.]
MKFARKLLPAFLVLAALFFGQARALAAGDASHGEQLYQGCQDCHSLDTNDVGPKHRGVFGRKAGSVPDYSYSAALKNSGITWTDDTLDKWLTNPQKLVLGSKMFYHLDSAQDRADVIEYLKQRAK